MLNGSRQRGVSFVELMIGIAIGLVLISGVLVLTVRISVASSANIQLTRLQQQMRATMDFMVRDLQRAGYVNWKMAVADCPERGANHSPAWNMADFYHCLTTVLTDMGGILPETLHEGSECILYSYDLDENGARNTGQFELFGFKLRDGMVVSRTYGVAHDCDTGIWQPITDVNLVVTSLDFRIEYLADAAAYRLSRDIDSSRWLASEPTAGCLPGMGALVDDKCIWRRTVVISLEGQLAADSRVTAKLVNRVKIKNDHLQSAL